MAEKKSELSKKWLDFIEGSEALSGIAPFIRERHIEIATIISKAGRLIDPRLINGVLTNRKGEWLRTGAKFNLRGRAPEGPVLERMIDTWRDDAERGLSMCAGNPAMEREAFVWEMHDRLMCMDPFKEANGRTARIALNHLRTLLKLPIAVIGVDDADAYFARLDAYRENVFIPIIMAGIPAVLSQPSALRVI